MRATAFAWRNCRNCYTAPDFRPHCLITCDTGISDGPAIGYAKDEGLTVIVTDHHDPEPDLLELAQDGCPIWAGDASGPSARTVSAAPTPSPIRSSSRRTILWPHYLA